MQVVRFTLESARTFDVPGVGQFVAGVLDVPTTNPLIVARARYKVPAYGAIESGTVDSATPAPTLPAAPATSIDRYPGAVEDEELDSKVAGLVRAPASAAAVALRAASVAAVQAAIVDGDIEVGAADDTSFQRFGSNLWTGDPTGSLTTAQITSSVADMTSKFGPRPLLLVLHIAYDSSNVLRIVQHGFNATGHAESKVDQAVTALRAAGFTFHGVKIHQYQITAEKITAQFWTDYRALVAQVTAKYKTAGIPYVFPVNEFESATGNPANTTAMQGLVGDVKAQGYKVGFCFNALNEAARCTVIDSLDAVGVNVYPSVSTKGLQATSDEVAEAWRQYEVVDWFRYRKRAFGQSCYVTETGSTDKTVSLEYTPDYGVTAYPDNNGQVVGTYWQGTLQYLAAEGDVVDGLFGWDDGLFSPFKFPASLDIMTRYAKAGVRS